ncbi:MAG TPA: hypothetical protein VGN87_14195, partial [Paenibacillus sp.]
MKHKLRKSGSIVLASLLAVAMVGCSSSNNSATSTPKIDTSDPAWQEAQTTPFGAYPETISYSVGQVATSYSALAGTSYEGDNSTNNVWTRYFKNKLNIQNTTSFESNDGTDYSQKVSMAIVSGEIPDLMVVPDYATLQQLYENDLIADL